MKKNTKKQRKREAKQGKRHRGKAEEDNLEWDFKIGDAQPDIGLVVDPQCHLDNSDIQENRPTEDGAPATPEAEAPASPTPPKSKSQLRKLRQIEEKRRKRDERVTVLTEIHEHRLEEVSGVEGRGPSTNNNTSPPFCFFFFIPVNT